MNILFIEDSEIDIYLLKRHLTNAKLEFDSTHVELAKDFLSAILTHKYDLILADYHIPSFTPYKALAALSAYSIHTPLIVVSGRLAREGRGCPSKSRSDGSRLQG